MFEKFFFKFIELFFYFFIKNYIEAHPEIIVIDRLDNIRKILDRYRQYMIIEESELAKEDKVFIPSFVELTSNNLIENLEKLKSANVKFPIGNLFMVDF